MPRLSIWMIRASLLYLALGFTFGGLLLFHKGIPTSPALWALLPAHIEFVLFGWTVQLAMGVAFWILPRFRLPPKRGKIWLAWLAFGLLNFGVLMGGFSPLLAGRQELSMLGRAAELGAVVTFILHAWPRIKDVGAE